MFKTKMQNKKISLTRVKCSVYDAQNWTASLDTSETQKTQKAQTITMLGIQNIFAYCTVIFLIWQNYNYEQAVVKTK